MECRAAPNTHAQPHAHSCTHTLGHTPTRTHMHTHAGTHPHADTHAHMQAHHAHMPLEVVACPSANGAECNGVGQCLSGVCVCGTNQGYTGDACDQCAPGFVPSGLVVGECVVLEVTPSMLVNAPIVSPPKQVRGVVAVVCMCA